MRLLRARLRSRYAAVGVAAALLPSLGAAQARPGRPEESGRLWAALGVGLAGQAQRCTGCVRSGTIGGPAVTVGAGVTLPRGFGVAVLGRAFQEFSYDFAQGSRYLVAVGEYAPPTLDVLTLNVGAGWGSHHGDTAPYANDGEGAVAAAGAALRVLGGSRVAVSLTLDVMQSVTGAASYRPRLISCGVSLSLAWAATDAGRH